MRLELIRVGLLVQLANHYTTRGAYVCVVCVCIETIDCGESANMTQICGKLDKSNS